MPSKATVLLSGFRKKCNRRLWVVNTGDLQITSAISSLPLVWGSRDPVIVLFSCLKIQIRKVKWVMQVYTGAVADLPHAYKSLEWNPISGAQDMGSQIQGLLSSFSWGPLLSFQCVLICPFFKDWLYVVGDEWGISMQRLESSSLLESPLSVCLQVVS